MAKENMELYVRVLFPRCPCSSEKAAGICFACGAALRSGSDVGRYTLAQSSCSSLSPRCWMMLRSGLSASLSSSSTQKNQLYVSVGKTGPRGNCYHNGRGTLLSNTVVAGYRRMWPSGLDKRCEVLQPKVLKVYSVAVESLGNTKCDQRRKQLHGGQNVSMLTFA